MKRMVIALFLLGLLLATILFGCQNSSAQLREALKDYSTMLEGDVPENLRLMIYYIDPQILTRVPVSKDRLMTFPGVVKIAIDSNELAVHWAQLKELDPSILQPVQEKSYMNARLYYVFKGGASDEILEVVISDIHGNVFVNGIEVEYNPVFYEIIMPFLTEGDCAMLGI